ncbi:opsin-5-like [Oncorhynchus mykiss]|uniref:G-protein coupled receptors family 1 profile domain-containing protein n=1 Tax=Oncorhynchus mykiss TaxID=8022 RepID=A0A8K9WLB9_ONCMY|nr:opsin-5-like [Oncorhynchus mykiss]
MGNASDTTLFVSTISKELDLLMGTFYSIFCVLSLLGNGILLLVAYRKRLSLKPAEFFIINLSISDLGMTLSLFPLAIPSAFAHKWLFDEITCQFYAMCGVLFGLCSLTNLTALSCICCLKVCFSNYGNKFSSSHACFLVVAVWCYASVFAIGPLAHWGHYRAEPYGTACCIDWNVPNYELSALSYIVCLFLFCYALPCTVIFLSYTFILLTVRGSHQAVQQHVSPQTKTTNAHALIVKLSVAVCIGFLGAWSPYAIVAMWAAFGDATLVPPTAFALAAIFAKSSTIYNPMVYLLCKPNFRKCLCRDTSTFRNRICRGSPRPEQKDPFGSTSQRNIKDMSVSNGQPESHRACLHSAKDGAHCHTGTTPQRTARILSGSTYSNATVSQLSAKQQAHFL